ncbi:MAG TPA: NRDE family protein, partial [Geothrix sp.]
FLEQLGTQMARYNPFNLLLFDGQDLLGYESRHAAVVSFSAGIHAVSNGDFDEPWPKVEGLKLGLATGLEDDEALLTQLGEAEPFADGRLPHTGVPIEWERALSPAFVRTPTYGTRASTLLRLGRESISILEQRYSETGPEGRSRFQYQRS